MNLMLLTIPVEKPSTLIALPVLIGIVTLALLVWAVLASHRRTRLEDNAFRALTRRPGYEPIRDPQELERLSHLTEDIFRAMRMLAREFTLLGALRIEHSRYTITAVHVLFGLERSNANNQTLDKVALLIEGFDQQPPEFLIRPNNMLLRQVNKQKIFAPTDRFGKNNLIQGSHRAAITHALEGKAPQLLADNRQFAIESRGGYLAGYTHDDSVQPSDFEAFLTMMTCLAEDIEARVSTYKPLQPDGRRLMAV